MERERDQRGRMDIGDWRRALFVDFEAVPDSDDKFFPVEIGVSVVGGRTQSRYIRPRPEWLPAKPSWQNHSRNLERAMSGVDADAITEWVLRTFVGRPLVSDAVFVDGPLLDRLLEGHDHGMRFVPFFATVESLRHEAMVDTAGFNAMIADIDADRGEAHTAGEDARVRAELVARLLALVHGNQGMPP